MAGDELRVLVVAADLLARAGLAALVSAEEGLTVVGQAPAEADLAAEVAMGDTDAVLWDLGWEPAAGLEQLASLADDLPPVVVLLPTGDDDGLALEAWSAGASAVLSRETDMAALVAALRAVAAGLVALDRGLVGATLWVRPAAADPAAGLLEDLTPRELQVLQLLAEGLPNKAIARRLNISDHTVKFHVNAILGKLGAQSRTEAVVRATRLGLILL